MTVILAHLPERLAAIKSCTCNVANEMADLAAMLPAGSQEQYELAVALCCYDKAAAAERRALGHIERARKVAA